MQAVGGDGGKVSVHRHRKATLMGQENILEKIQCTDFEGQGGKTYFVIVEGGTKFACT